MADWILGGLLTGMAAGTACLAVCGCMLLPLVLAARRDLWRSYGVLLQFSAGRLAAYLAVGALAGWGGALVHDTAWYPWANAGLTFLAGALLLHWLAQPARRDCGAACGTTTATVPILLGVVTGLSICPPFVAALATAVTSGNILRGTMYFAAFFVGTTVYLLPLPLAGGLTRWPFWLRAGRMVGAVIGFVYCLTALQHAYGLVHPRANVTGAAAQIVSLPQEVHAFFDGATRCVRSETDEYVILVHSNSTLLGYLVDTRHAPDLPIGHGGPTPVLLCVRLPQAQAAVLLAPNQETPAFLRRVLVSAWWRELQCGSLTDMLARTTVPDAVSGATLSARALQATVNDAFERVCRVAPGLQRWSVSSGTRSEIPRFAQSAAASTASAVATRAAAADRDMEVAPTLAASTASTVATRAAAAAADRDMEVAPTLAASTASAVATRAAAAAADRDMEVAPTLAASTASAVATRALAHVAWPFAVVACMAVCLVLWPQLQTRWTRWAVWLMSIALIGVYRADYFSIAQVAALVRGTMPPVYYSNWAIVVLFALLAPLMFGRVYCQYICPFGVLSDALGRVVPWRLTLPPWLVGPLRRLRAVLLIAIGLAMVLAPRFPFERCEPFCAVFVPHQPRAYLAFAALVLLVSLVMKRFWCAYFCVDGALFEFIHRYRWNKESRP
jgi:sulfite exporter TauE/SafE